jgi:hypothetical protein
MLKFVEWGQRLFLPETWSTEDHKKLPRFNSLTTMPYKMTKTQESFLLNLILIENIKFTERFTLDLKYSYVQFKFHVSHNLSFCIWA